MKLKDKCDICSAKIQKSFLEKVIGTMVKDEKGKAHTICFECQKKFPSKKEILAHIK